MHDFGEGLMVGMLLGGMALYLVQIVLGKMSGTRHSDVDGRKLVEIMQRMKETH